MFVNFYSLILIFAEGIVAQPKVPMRDLNINYHWTLLTFSHNWGTIRLRVLTLGNLTLQYLSKMSRRGPFSSLCNGMPSLRKAMVTSLENSWTSGRISHDTTSLRSCCCFRSVLRALSLARCCSLFLCTSNCHFFLNSYCKLNTRKSFVFSTCKNSPVKVCFLHRPE